MPLPDYTTINHQRERMGIPLYPEGHPMHNPLHHQAFQHVMGQGRALGQQPGIPPPPGWTSDPSAAGGRALGQTAGPASGMAPGLTVIDPNSGRGLRYGKRNQGG